LGRLFGQAINQPVLIVHLRRLFFEDVNIYTTKEMMIRKKIMKTSAAGEKIYPRIPMVYFFAHFHGSTSLHFGNVLSRAFAIDPIAKEKST
jgi:hypothetical protein